MKRENIKFILVEYDKVYFGSEEVVAFLNLKEPVVNNFQDAFYIPSPSMVKTDYREFQITGKFIHGTIRNAAEALTEQQWNLLEQFKKSLLGELKTSEEWSKLYTFKILDPDGWDRKNFDYSWFHELITREEFHHRAMCSTIEARTWMDEE